MSKTIRFTFKIGSTPTDATSVLLRDPTGAYGIKRNDTGAVIVAAGTSFVHAGTGLYSYTFNEPQAGLSYDYVIQWTYAGETFWQKQTLATVAPGPGGTIPIPPAQYIQMGVESVSCGDADLYAWLNQEAATVWALQTRRAVALDLWYQYFVLDLIALALDHVRMLIDTETGDTQSTTTGYNNSSNTTDYSSTTNRSRTSAQTQSAISSDSFTRSSSRVTSASQSQSANRNSSLTGSGSDTSTTSQAMTGTTSRSSASSSRVSGSGAGSSSQDSDTTQSGGFNMNASGSFNRLQLAASLPGLQGLAAVSGQSGNQFNAGGATQNAVGASHGDGTLSHTRTITGSNSATGLNSTTSTGSRINNIARTSHSALSGSSASTSNSSLTSSSHDERHRAASSSAHSSFVGQSTMDAGSTAHREGAGASQMALQGTFDREYYDQIFQSLKQMWEDTKVQIERLEKLVLMPARYLTEKLSVVYPQATLVGQASLPTDPYLVQRPGAPGTNALGLFPNQWNRYIVR